MTVRIIQGDCLVEIPRLVGEGVIVDSIVTDSPYHLTARTSRFGKEGSAPPQYGRDGAMGRLSKGFMGQQWDGGDVAFRPETWATIATIVRPGAFLLAFGGTRTAHRLTCAIEDGGFVIQDCILWLYGTGFPKRRDMLKPAYEPIVLAYKPGGKRTMQVDESRIETCGVSPSVRRREAAAKSGNYGRLGDKTNGEYGRLRANGNREEGLRHYLAGKESEALGRWPANVCHDGSDEVVSMFPNSRGQRADVEGTEGRRQGTAFETFADPKAFVLRGDTGSAARFFWSPKAGKKDRSGSRHPTVKPISLLSWLVPLVTPVGGIVLDPFAGSGTTGAAAEATGRSAILIEQHPEYIADIRRRFNGTLEDAMRRLTVAIRSMTDGAPL